MNKMYNICLLLYFRSFIAEMKFYVNKIRQSKSMIFWYFFFFLINLGETWNLQIYFWY